MAYETHLITTRPSGMIKTWSYPLHLSKQSVSFGRENHQTKWVIFQPATVVENTIGLHQQKESDGLR